MNEEGKSISDIDEKTVGRKLAQILSSIRPVSQPVRKRKKKRGAGFTKRRISKRTGRSSSR